ncbi:MAG: lipoprotein insertase outer membrane protein LolB [Pseudomonadota bacterium]
MRILVCLLLLVWLSGCATLVPEPVAGLSDEQRRLLYAFNDWRVQGRIAVRADDESWQASLDWRHQPDVETLRLSGPLGQGGVDVQMSDAFIRITQADGTTEVSSRPEELLAERIGFPVPLGALRYWVVGVPAPDRHASLEYDEAGRLRMIRQMGWAVEYERYMTVGDKVLPQKLVVRKGGIMLKLVVDQWYERVGHG